MDLLKALITPAQLDRFLPNFAGRLIETIYMFPMSLTFELYLKWRQNGGTAAILDLPKSVISPEQLDRFLPNFAGRRTEDTDMLPMSFNV